MYAIAFDLKIDDLKKHYGDPYNGAYAEIEKDLDELGFSYLTGNCYVLKGNANPISVLNNMLNKLVSISYFKKLAMMVRVVQVEGWIERYY